MLFSVPCFINMTQEQQAEFSIFYKIILLFVILAYFVTPLFTTLALGLQLLLSGKINFNIAGKNFVFDVLNFIFSLVFHIFLLFITATNLILMSKSPINGLSTYLFYLIIILTMFYAGKVVRRQHNVEASSLPIINEKEGGLKNTLSVIFTSVVICFLFIHFSISYLINFIENDLLKGTVKIETTKTYFVPEQKLIGLVKQITSMKKIQYEPVSDVDSLKERI